MTVVDVPVSAAGREGVAKARALLGTRQDPAAPIAARRQSLAAFAQAAGEPEGVTIVEDNIADVRVDRIAAPAARGRLLYIHGGAFVLGSIRTHRSLAAAFAQASGMAVYAVEYRLAPEHPYPAALDDILSVWRAIAGTAEPVAWLGDSAGAGLALAAIIAARDEGLALPAALVLLSPWVDLTCAGDSHATKAADEIMLTTEGLALDADRYCGSLPAADPRVSPLFADLSGLPRTLIQVGDDEILRDDATRLYERMTAAGGTVTLETWEAMVHAWHAFRAMLPEAGDAIRRAGAFAKAVAGS